ncbi:MAG: PilZ domain-containing protein [Oligoflexia bacterium]|nr:PilZ domain-containing protein [Oligoflexia bacterium]
MNLNMDMFKYGHERRKYPRKSVSLESRIYSSIKRGSYSCKVKDIGMGGAFISSPFMPRIGEIITFELLTRYYKLITTGNAKVVWLKNQGPLNEHGFGIRFDVLLDDDSFKEL